MHGADWISCLTLSGQKKPSTRQCAGDRPKTAKLLSREKAGCLRNLLFFRGLIVVDALLKLAGNPGRTLHIHPWHAAHTAHAVAAGAGTLFFFHQLGHHRFGGEE